MATTVSAGELRDRIRIDQNNGTTSNEIGEEIPGWTVLATLWGKVEPMSTGEQWRRQQMNASANWKVTIRYRSDVRSTMRVVKDGRTFEIEGVTNPDMKKRFLELACKELVAI